MGNAIYWSHLTQANVLADILVLLANILVLLADILVLLADILYVANILVCLLGMEPYTRKGIQCIHEEPYVERLKRLLWRLQYSMYTQYVTLEPFSRHNMSLWSLYQAFIWGCTMALRIETVCICVCPWQVTLRALRLLRNWLVGSMRRYCMLFVLEGYFDMYSMQYTTSYLYACMSIVLCDMMQCIALNTYQYNVCVGRLH